MPVAVVRTDRSRRALGGLTLGLALAAGTGCTKLGSLPKSGDEQFAPTGAEQAAIEQREICVGSSVASAGELGDVLFYRATALPDGKLVVGYFAFFSEERPWGNNWLTWTVLPAIAVDAVYTRAMFFGPGLQRAISGKGDVEGFRIQYGVAEDGTLNVEHAEADDGLHRPVHLDAAQVFALDPKRPTFYTEVWSHQLGGRGARSMSELAYVRCFGAGRVRPLPEAIASDFALNRRALPAHVEALGGEAVGSFRQAQARTSIVQPQL